MTPFEQVGGQAGVDALVDEFYRVMSTDPAAKDCLAVHPGDLTSASTKLKAFLTGWLGGPPIYVETYGHPRMRMRHIAFAIGEREREQWLYCMETALDARGVQGPVRADLDHAFRGLAERIQNR